MKLCAERWDAFSMSHRMVHGAGSDPASYQHDLVLQDDRVQLMPLTPFR